MHPTKVVLIYSTYPESSDKPEMVTIVYNDQELESITKDWTDDSHYVDWMWIDYSIRGE